MRKPRLPEVRAVHDIRWGDGLHRLRYCAAIQSHRKRDILCTRLACMRALGLDFCRQHGALAEARGVHIVAASAEHWEAQRTSTAD
jgi:hypothetical protein